MTENVETSGLIQTRPKILTIQSCRVKLEIYQQARVVQLVARRRWEFRDPSSNPNEGDILFRL